MGKIAIIISLFFFGFQSYGQGYHAMLGDSTKWNITYEFEGCGTLILNAKIDTVINGQSYKIVESNDYYHLRAGYIREDTANRKVYYRNNLVQSRSYSPVIDSEFVLYDFNLITSDSIYLYTPNLNYYGVFQPDTLGWIHVDSTGIINTLVGPRKIIYLKTDTSQYSQFPEMRWVEGIGALGMPYLWGRRYGGSGITFLDCSYKNTIHQYSGGDWLGYPDTVCYCNWSGINETANNQGISIYPNPVQHNFTVTINAANLQQAKLTITDMLGRNVKQVEVTDKTTTIDFGNFPSGIYFISVQTSDKVYSSKIMKTNY